MLDLFAGGNYTRESYSTGILRSVAAATVGDTFTTSGTSRPSTRPSSSIRSWVLRGHIGLR